MSLCPPIGDEDYRFHAAHPDRGLMKHEAVPGGSTVLERFMMKILTESSPWSSRLGVRHRADNPIPEKKLMLQKHRRSTLHTQGDKLVSKQHQILLLRSLQMHGL